LTARRGMLARTTPELESYAQLFERCLHSMEDILSGRMDPASLLCSATNKPVFEAIYRGENRLSAVVNAVVSKGLDVLGENVRKEQRKNIRVLELGPGTLSDTRSIFDTLLEYSCEIDYYFSGQAGLFSELKLSSEANDSPFINFHAIALEDVEGVADDQKFDIVRLRLPLLASDHLERCVRLAAKVMRKEGVLLLSDLAEADLLTFTLGMMDPGWIFGVSSASVVRSPQEAVENATRILTQAGLVPSEVMGRWLISCGLTDQDSTAFALNLATKVDQQPPIHRLVIPTKHTLLTRGQRLVEYAMCGHGEPVILLTAMAFESSIWQQQIDAFADRYQLILPHLPGHGGSIFNGKSFTFEDLADDLIDIMDQLDIESAHLVGWCMAGNIGQLLAVRNPRRLRSLTLVCTTPTDARTRGLGGDDLAVYSESPLFAYEIEFQNIYGELYYDNRMVEGYLAHISQSHAVVDSEAVLYYVSNLFDFDALGILNDIRMPTLVISGKWDIAFPPDQVKLLHNGIPNSKYYEFSQSGHMPFLNEAEAFNRVFEEFIMNTVQIEDAEKREIIRSGTSGSHIYNGPKK
jgi:3-oxoadipate enol-lactonase